MITTHFSLSLSLSLSLYRMNIPTHFESNSSGSEVMPYLQPLPPRGTGFHRFVFSLFTHAEPLDLRGEQLGCQGEQLNLRGEQLGLTAAAEGGRGTWLDQRSFSTHSFLSCHPQLELFTFALFQSQWDSSVQRTFSDVLGEIVATLYKRSRNFYLSLIKLYNTCRTFKKDMPEYV